MPANKIKIEPALQRRFARQTIRKNKQKRISCKFLIVCEGEKTEPNYFKSFPLINNGSYVYELEVYGGKINTIGVVDKALELKNANPNKYDSVWAVFDKDDFPAENFNQAIINAKNNGINVAWSNEAFELWYLLHFDYIDGKLSRKDYENKITEKVKETQKWRKNKNYKYQKNDIHNYEIMNQCGSMENAIKHAKRLHDLFIGDQRFHLHKPCTTVYLLVNQLLGRDKDLIDKVMEKINK